MGHSTGEVMKLGTGQVRTGKAGEEGRARIMRLGKGNLCAIMSCGVNQRRRRGWNGAQVR